MSSVTIVLPLPHPLLSPNARPHPIVKSKVTKRARIDAKYATLNIMNRREVFGRWNAATVQATFYFKSNRARDKDNAQASCKAYFDGIADARLVTNDSGLTHLPVVFDVDRKDPRLVLTITRT